MHSVLTLLLIVATLILVVGAVIMVIGLKRAPEGYEGEKGFQYGGMPTGQLQTQFSMVEHHVTATAGCPFAGEQQPTDHSSDLGLASLA